MGTPLGPFLAGGAGRVGGYHDPKHSPPQISEIPDNSANANRYRLWSFFAGKPWQSRIHSAAARGRLKKISRVGVVDIETLCH
jgi:hypothetical protein